MANEAKRLGNWTKNSLHFVASKTLDGAEFVANQTRLGLISVAYLNGLGIPRLQHAVFEPTLFEEGIPQALKKAGILAATIPLSIKEKDRNGNEKVKSYPAAKTLAVRRWYRPDFPIAKVSAFDQIKGRWGDEVIDVELSGKIAGSKDPIYIKWKIWQDMTANGEILGIMGPGGKPIIKHPSEYDLDDVVMIVMNRINAATGGKVEVLPDHLKAALLMVAQSTEAGWSQRLEEMADRSEFVANMNFYGQDMVDGARTVITAPGAEFEKILNEIDAHEKTWTWSEWKKRLRQIQGGHLGGGLAAIPAILHRATDVVPNSGSSDDLANYTADDFVSRMGIKFWNRRIHNLRTRVHPMLVQTADKITDIEVNALGSVHAYLDARADAWLLLRDTIEKESKSLNPQVRSKALAMLADIEKEIQELEAPEIKSAPAAIPASAKKKE